MAISFPASPEYAAPGKIEFRIVQNAAGDITLHTDVTLVNSAGEKSGSISVAQADYPQAVIDKLTTFATAVRTKVAQSLGTPESI